MATQRGGKQAVRNGGSGMPGWGLILVGIVIGGLLVFFAAHRGWIPSVQRNDQPQANPNAVAEPGSAAGIAASGSAASASKFDFYKVLPEKEVVIPNAELSAMAKAEQQKAAAANNTSATTPASAGAATSAGGYVLQVGAFPNASDADAMKAKLALQGFTAQVQTVTLDGQVWNRVRLGPFASATQLQDVQQRLTAAGIHSVPLKEK
ncbi:MAG TPA: SPOR domain-containing protein [Rhodanobacteraceae bacterium]|nr:SPOR domain-containing protein [Rhodanobacteraceae bacterium]